MAKAILISIQPKWVEKIARCEKTIEVRKTMPKLETPFKVYIYCTKGRGDCLWEWRGHIAYDTQFPNERPNRLDGKVIGEFICDRIDRIGKRGINNNFDYCYLSLNEWGNDDVEIEITDIQKSCISKSELNAYGANSSCLYAWHISDLKIYDKPKELSEFWTVKCTNKKGSCIGCEVKPNCIKTITRPPQSYMFVEDLGD